MHRESVDQHEPRRGAGGTSPPSFRLRGIPRAALACLTGGALAAMLVGCQTPSSTPRQGHQRASESALVFSTPAVLRAEQGYGLSPFMEPEYGRRDAQLSARGVQPILGQDLWVVPLPPLERPIRFQRWKQD